MASGYPDYEGGKSRVYSVADWSVIQGIEVNLTASGANQVWGVTIGISSLIPAGTTRYLTGVSWVIAPAAAADYDHHAHFEGYIKENLAGTYLAAIGGNGGGYLSLTRPLVFAAGEICRLEIVSRCNVRCNMRVTGWGYDV